MPSFPGNLKACFVSWILLKTSNLRGKGGNVLHPVCWVTFTGRTVSHVLVGQQKAHTKEASGMLWNL